ncbi:alpha/beta fold hydrolase [Hymenobacter chitinivorans]|uniref:Pimeloyl-ACP methyl ester carboxylesterase n=1 Tax=Hymenobacter chitinivorans DSM 11115 TaxID=1121954 RepID=A0A2M9BLK8_9BACT|nr:alpha/beta hydrolase [Hymenobacter chitinivorans]PJJ58811.1 pimeloyl-ACP methyl ester carboxylesterase [Hymenobacter chitinivorans DSM 11115]
MLAVKRRVHYELEHHYVDTNGIRLHVVQCGPVHGPLVVLLHGFPEFWYAWHRQLHALAAAGYRVWAPDQRGYNLSEKPRRVADYRVDALAQDVLGLLDAAGEQQAFIVGHDWGAAVTWHLAAHYPTRVRKAAVLNVPHPSVMVRTLRRSVEQLRKSWYIFFFQLPVLPEWLVRRRNWAFGRQALVGSSRRGTFSTADLAEYVAAWQQPRAMRSMINWYRAAVRAPRQTKSAGRVTVPVHIIWGVKDAFLKREMAEKSLLLCDQAQLTYLPASHWVQHEEAEAVNALLLRFFDA